MLDEYEVEQSKVVKILKNSILKDKISHAYLFETNGYKNKKNVALAFAKMILCPYHYSNNKDCVNCTQCKNIDKNIFPEIKIIEPDGLWIKKEQLDVLQKEFSEKSILSNKKIYIINNADRLNKSASNSILKFLEEPEENIIAILITDNMYQLLNTIISRCQIISFTREHNISTTTFVEKIKNFINISEKKQNTDETILAQVEQVIEFIKYYEKNKIDTILKTQKLWHNNFKEKDDILFAINVMILFYQDILNYKLDRNIKIFNPFEEQIRELANNNTTMSLTKKMNILIQSKQKINVNINASLFIDKIIMDLERCD